MWLHDPECIHWGTVGDQPNELANEIEHRASVQGYRAENDGS